MCAGSTVAGGIANADTRTDQTLHYRWPAVTDTRVLWQSLMAHHGVFHRLL